VWEVAPDRIAWRAASSPSGGTTKIIGVVGKRSARSRRTSIPVASRSLLPITTASKRFPIASWRACLPDAAVRTRQPLRVRAATLRIWCSSFPSTTRTANGGSPVVPATAEGVVWAMDDRWAGEPSLRGRRGDPMPSFRRRGPRAGREGPFRDQDRHRAEVPHPFEQEVQLGAAVLHLRHRLEHIEGIDDEDGDRIHLHHVVAIHLEELEPGATPLEVVQVFPDVPHVERRDARRGALVRHAEGGHVLEGEVLALFEGEVRGL